MNKRLLCTTLLAFCGAAALALPAFAQTPADSTQTQSAAAAPSHTKPPATASDHHDARQASPLYGTRMCIRDTGSLIPAPKGQCLPVPGNSYSQQDIRRTGATNIGQALQMLDPSVSVGH